MRLAFAGLHTPIRLKIFAITIYAISAAAFFRYADADIVEIAWPLYYFLHDTPLLMSHYYD